VNNVYGKIMHRRTVGRGFIVIPFAYILDIANTQSH
jgi:hypothetical protein